MNFNDIKELCKQHEECLRKTELIEYSNKEKIWLKVANARGENFYLSDDEIKTLLDYINNKGLKIENKVSEILNSYE